MHYSYSPKPDDSNYDYKTSAKEKIENELQGKIIKEITVQTILARTSNDTKTLIIAVHLENSDDLEEK